jgi:hypothetical protein
LEFTVQGKPVEGTSPAIGNVVVGYAAVPHIGNKHRCRQVSGGKGVSKDYGVADRGNVVVLTALLNVELQVSTNAEEILAPEGYPVPKRPAYTEVGVIGNAFPPTNLFGCPLAESNFIRLIPTALIGVVSLVSI